MAMMLAMPASARLTFTQRIQQKSGAKVLLRQDKDIDLLVNGREADPAPVPAAAPAKPAAKPTAAKPTAAKPTTPKSTTTPAHNAPSTLLAKPENTAPTSTTATTATTAPTATAAPKTTAPKSTAYTTRAGWRVKFFTGGSSRADKENAQAAGREFKRLFPDTPVYMHFVSPHWICVAGDFVNKEDADAFIGRVRESGQFKAAGMTVMKSRVKVPVE